MNYAVIYCVACLVLCTVSITKRFGLRNIEYVGVDALTVTKRQLFGTFIIFSAITLFLPVLLQKLLRILLVNRNWSDASLDLATNGLSQLVLLSFVIYIYKCLHIKNMKQPWSSILGESLCGFGVALPVVWLVSYLWLTLLIFLNK
ncbi:MAG: hypothetical protein LBS87_03405, partial [Puniceicoccales bacterium]|nr:hypothetical protein [Puniceicoccales bacterium]